MRIGQRNDYTKNRFSARLTLYLVKLVGMHRKKVILELIRSKCIPILIYGLECLALEIIGFCC